MVRAPLTQHRASRKIVGGTDIKKLKHLKSPISLVESHSYYSIDIQVGSPPQTIAVLLDTGSSDLWVPGNACSPTVCKSQTFDEALSHSFIRTDKEFQVHYAVGSATGSLCKDVVKVNEATVINQEFGYATHIEGIEGTIGTLGLAFPSLAESYQGYSPFFNSLIAQGSINRAVFSIYLHDGKKTSGEIIFGGVDDSKHKGDLQFMALTESETKRNRPFDNVSPYDFWQVQGLGVGVKRKKFKKLLEGYNLQYGNTTVKIPDRKYNDEQVLYYGFRDSEESNFKFDTGTTYTYLPSLLVKQIVSVSFRSGDYQFDDESKQYEVSCSQKYYKGTSIQFKMSPGRNAKDRRPIVLNVPLSDLIRPKNGDSAESATYCIFGIAPTIDEDPSIFIGLSVIRSAYMVFDLENTQIGIAGAKGSSASVKREGKKA